MNKVGYPKTNLTDLVVRDAAHVFIVDADQVVTGLYPCVPGQGAAAGQGPGQSFSIKLNNLEYLIESGLLNKLDNSVFIYYTFIDLVCFWVFQSWSRVIK